MTDLLKRTVESMKANNGALFDMTQWNAGVNDVSDGPISVHEHRHLLQDEPECATPFCFFGHVCAAATNKEIDAVVDRAVGPGLLVRDAACALLVEAYDWKFAGDCDSLADKVSLSLDELLDELKALCAKHGIKGDF